MPSTARTFANLELKQGEDYELTIDMDSSWSDTGCTYQARIVKDFSGTTFQHLNDAGTGTETSAFEAMTVVSDDTGSTNTLKVSLTAAQTDALPDDFEGYWDVLERTSSGELTRQAEGEVIVFNSATPVF